MSDETLMVGKASTTLDYLKGKYEWLGAALEEYERKIRSKETIIGELTEKLIREARAQAFDDAAAILQRDNWSYCSQMMKAKALAERKKR